MGVEPALAHADLVGEAADGEALETLDGGEPSSRVDDRAVGALTIGAPASLGCRPGCHRFGRRQNLARSVVLCSKKCDRSCFQHPDGRSGVRPHTGIDPTPELVDRLFRAAWAMCGSRHDAEDLVQETFARVLARRRVFRRGDPTPYLMTTLRNTYVTQLRTASRRPRTTELPVEESEAVASSLARPEAALEQRAVFDAIAALPEDFRAALGRSTWSASHTARPRRRSARARRRSRPASSGPGGTSPARSSATAEGLGSKRRLGGRERQSTGEEPRELRRSTFTDVAIGLRPPEHAPSRAFATGACAGRSLVPRRGRRPAGARRHSRDRHGGRGLGHGQLDVGGSGQLFAQSNAADPITITCRADGFVAVNGSIPATARPRAADHPARARRRSRREPDRCERRRRGAVPRARRRQP